MPIPPGSTAPPLDPPPAAELDLRRHIRTGDAVMWGQGCAEPRTLTRRLAEQRPDIGPLRCFLGVSLGEEPALSPGPDLATTSYGGAGSNRGLARDGELEILPSHYSELPALIESGQLRVDVVLVQVSPGPDSGHYRLTLAAEYLVAAVRTARTVIAELNSGAPVTPDAPTISAAEITVLVAASYPPAEQLIGAPGAAELAIAGRVAELVEDGATLQLGLGATPEAIARGLTGHRDLGVHSGAVGDAVADLTELGVITNSAKGRDHGVSVTGLILGSARLLSFADGNPGLALRSTAYTHDPAILATLPKFTAINSAIEIDLTGQVNSEVAGGVYVGAVGGALDFLRAARRSVGGRPIIALRSTAGARSRIVAELSGPVTVPRADVAIVVTEHGVADLRGLTLSERRERLLELADPAHAAQLEATPPSPGQRHRP